MSIETIAKKSLPKKLKLRITVKHLIERIKWAITKPGPVVKAEGQTMKQANKLEKDKEAAWGNKMIQQEGNGQWTTKLGEGLVYDVLERMNKNPRKPDKKKCRECGFEPDWETDDFVWEVKTSNWWVPGTAGEKVLGTAIKYQSIPEIFGKPLRIVCLANQEYELEYGKTKYFGEHVTKKTQQVLDLFKSWDIEYVRFSDLISSLSYE